MKDPVTLKKILMRKLIIKSSVQKKCTIPTSQVRGGPDLLPPQQNGKSVAQSLLMETRLTSTTCSIGVEGQEQHGMTRDRTGLVSVSVGGSGGGGSLFMRSRSA